MQFQAAGVQVFLLVNAAKFNSITHKGKQMTLEDITHEIVKEENGTMTVKFSAEDLEQEKQINVFDLTTQQEKLERINQHKNAFFHRINIGMVKTKEEVLEPTPE